MKSSIFRRSLLLVLCIISLVYAQSTPMGAGLTEKNTQGFIETRKLFLFDTTSGFQPNASGSLY